MGTATMRWMAGALAVSTAALLGVTGGPAAVLEVPQRVEGTGTSGSTSVDVTLEETGRLVAEASGLSPMQLLRNEGTGPLVSGHSGSTAEVFYIDFQVPPGATYLQVEADSVNDSADFDITSWTINDGGGNGPVGSGSVVSPAPDEVFERFDPLPFRYDFLIEAPYDSEFDFLDVRAVIVTADGSPLVVTPSVISGQPGQERSVDLAWSDLEPDSSYYGTVGWQGTSARTLLHVDTGSQTPLPPTPTNLSLPRVIGPALSGSRVTADPGRWDPDDVTLTYQWRLLGAVIEGATGPTLLLDQSFEGLPVSVAVTAASGGAVAGRESEEVTVKAPTATTLSLDRAIVAPGTPVHATVKVAVTTRGDKVGGTARLYIDGRPSTTFELTVSNDRVTLPALARGVHVVKVRFEGDFYRAASISRSRVLIVR